MSDSSGCKIVLLMLFVALFAGALGFAAGFASHAVLVAAEPATVVLSEPDSRPTLAPTAMPADPSEGADPSVDAEASSSDEGAPTSESQPTEVPAPVPTIAIPEASGEAFDLFWEVWNLIQDEYYGELPTAEELTFGAIRGATGSLDDPYTAFIDPAAAEHRRQTEGGSYEGIGAMVSMEDGYLEIVEPFKDHPAEKAGLKAGDIVLEVDDTKIENMSIYEAIALILGPAGTDVRLLVVREGEEPFEVVVTRAQIDIPLVESEMREDGIAYVSLSSFDSDSTAQLEEEIEKLLDQNPDGLVFDLRSNPGGFLHEAILTMGLFVPRDEIVMIERTQEEEITLRPADFGSRGPVVGDIPVVVLVNAGSASASEIVAGALQDLDRAVLIGAKTFGKGSVQLVHELSNGAELRVTKARWFTPNDRAIHGEGLDPDIESEISPEDAEAEVDTQLERAIEYLLTGQ